MYTQQEIDFIRDTVSGICGASFDGLKVQAEEGPGCSIEEADGRILLRAESRSALARAWFRLAQERTAGRTPVSVHETKHFESCGSFLDFSRNGVMTVKACKKYIAYSASLGLDAVVLYTEDTYTVPEYPYMGYLRGRLTPEEYQELDAYADALGVELIPCIQTLAHLANFLQWGPNAHLQDQPAVLMCDDEETYAFIEAEIRAVRGYVRGKRLHIGMDEAHGIGLGEYFRRFGPTDRFELLSRHLNRVVEICKKYDFQPIMWSDMFYRLGSKTGDYYDLEAKIPQSVIDSLPDVDLCYWDYYHTEAKWYNAMLEGHARMSDNTSFAGGIWIWSGFLPHVNLTRETMEVALPCCVRHRTRTVLATTWGDDGNETSPFLVLNQLPIFSEYCWRGEACTHEIIAETGAFLTGVPDRAYNAFSLFYPTAKDQRTGKELIWCDLLYPLGPTAEDLPAALERSCQALEILADYQELEACQYAAALFEVCKIKATLLMNIRPLYLHGERDQLRKIATEDIPRLLAAYDRLRTLHKAQWESVYKRNGWEVLAVRYGGVEGRLRDVQDAILRWCDGTLDTLCELDETPLDPNRQWGSRNWHVLVSPVYSL